MITNGTAEPQNYYRLKFAGLPYDLYEYGATALDAINNAKQELDGLFAYLGNATARPAVYKEWNYGTERYTNGGDFIR